MPPRKQWDDEEEDTSSDASSPPLPPTRRANKFDDEEGEDSDVLDSWDAGEDSEVEREKAKKAAEAKAKADAEAAANKKSKAQRIAELKAERARALEAADTFDDETEEEKRARLRRAEKESDLKHAEDLFGDASRPSRTISSAVVVDSKDPTNAVDLGAMPLFNPTTKAQFETLRTTLVPLLTQHVKRPHYTLFLQEFSKQLAEELPSDQIKKIASSLTTLSNTKLKEEKAAEKGGKKTKGQKKPAAVVSARAPETDTTAYDNDAFGDDDFM